eukprot:CAMPEP_0172372924 /NCGR_PEP_ID=MMETSP1060-20121228/49782_1 /TAXON_ID=37318 /ORGANISM="Pseudo-nitzschia pungens, Strain cf. cingulata" /LENGTH=223 /DNA_ID=CAMNT_0013099093 /DNA_START=98 /DNA_END=769 /DNA_ORIENTATION=+
MKYPFNFTSSPTVLSVAIQLLLLFGWSNVMVFAEEPSIATDEPFPSPTTTTETTSVPTHAYIEDCKLSGFDPLQLACTTCAVLPAKHERRCHDCCQSYKTLEKRSKRYEFAVLVNTGYPESVQEVLRDDKDQILEQKGSSRLQVHDLSAMMNEDAMMAGMMGLFHQRQQPSAIFWFDRSLGSDMQASLEQLYTLADEVTILSGRGLGRDDIRDMLLALLPDKE